MCFTLPSQTTVHNTTQDNSKVCLQQSLIGNSSTKLHEGTYTGRQACMLKTGISQGHWQKNSRNVEQNSDVACRSHVVKKNLSLNHIIFIFLLTLN